MKKLSPIFLVSLIMIKILLGSIFIYQVEVDTLSLGRNAIASEPQKNSKATLVNDRPQGVTSNKVDGKHDDKALEKQIDLNFLLKKKAEIEEKEARLAQKQEELMAIKEDIAGKIEKLTRLRDEIRVQMATKKTLRERKLKHLIKAYSAMRPQKAASLFEKLEMRFSVELLSHMKGDIVGNILSFMEIDRAAKISEQLAKKK